MEQHIKIEKESRCPYGGPYHMKRTAGACGWECGECVDAYMHELEEKALAQEHAAKKRRAAAAKAAVPWGNGTHLDGMRKPLRLRGRGSQGTPPPTPLVEEGTSPASPQYHTQPHTHSTDDEDEEGTPSAALTPVRNTNPVPPVSDPPPREAPLPPQHRSRSRNKTLIIRRSRLLGLLLKVGALSTAFARTTKLTSLAVSSERLKMSRRASGRYSETVSKYRRMRC